MNKNFSRIFSSPPNDSAGRAKRNFWQRLVEPPAPITDVAEQRQMSLVSALLLFIIPAMSFGVVINAFFLHALTTAGILVGSVIVLSIAYILTRTKHYRVSLPLLLAVTALYSTLSIGIGNNYSSESLLTIFIFNILAILISGTLASFRITFFLAAANFLELLLLPILIPSILFSNMVIPLIFNGVVSVLVLVLTRHRNLTEKDRLLEVDKINSVLQASNADLNALSHDLNARTRDLNLAIEVGRSVSQVRALDVMLKDAAEIIRSRFDLYYVQVYLTDPSQTNLVLQSGTGSVGAELVGRGHSLPLNTGSINGRAAIEKRSMVISDTASNPAFRPNHLLPDTRSEMAVPLLVGDKVVGVLDMQSTQAGALSEESLSAFEALAGQLAIAIQNANLLSETNQARAEVESQARRLSRANWVDYLDAIHKPEQTGFVFEGSNVTPLVEAEGLQPPAEGNAISAPIAITGELLGSLVVEMDVENQSTQNVELVNIVARQVGQQIESLRLLESAERYRAEAEQASRRTTRDGWKDYMDANAGASLSYIYDLKEVRPFNQAGDQQTEESAFSLPLKVRDETVGKLVVQGLAVDDSEALELANAVVERLSAHIENLRLSEQNRERAERERALRQITSAVRGSTDPATILRAAVRELGTLLGRKTVIRLATTDQASQSQRPTDLVEDSAATSGNEPVPPAESSIADGVDK